VCWSLRSRIPRLILADGRVVWRVTAEIQKQIPTGSFEINDEGYVRNDANQDIEMD
jgi:hypothetical protein